VNEDVDLQASEHGGQIVIASVERYRVFERQADCVRGGTRPPEVPATHDHSHGRGRGKCGGNALTEESIAAQHKNRAH
jgi:hypothetical protein